MQHVVTTLPNIPGQKIVQDLGLITGDQVRSRNAFSDFKAGFKSFIGGEIGAYTKLVKHTFQNALQEMVAQARSLGANAVVDVKISPYPMLPDMHGVSVSGTAVVVEPAKR